MQLNASTEITMADVLCTAVHEMAASLEDDERVIHTKNIYCTNEETKRIGTVQLFSIDIDDKTVRTVGVSLQDIKHENDNEILSLVIQFVEEPSATRGTKDWDRSMLTFFEIVDIESFMTLGNQLGNLIMHYLRDGVQPPRAVSH